MFEEKAVTAQRHIAEEQSLFPTAVSEKELDEAKRKNTFKELFGSSKIFLEGEKPPQRPDLQGGLIIQNKAAQHYTEGKEAMTKFQYEKAVICFSKASVLQPQQTQLYVSQAEAYLQLCDFQSAAACYKQAWHLEPEAFSSRLAFIYCLQGQCLYDRGCFLEALEAFSKAAEVKPGCRAYEVRRSGTLPINSLYSNALHTLFIHVLCTLCPSLTCLAAAGLHSDCLKLVNDWMATGGPTSDLYILRARLHRQLNQTPQCYQDVKSALALNPTCPQAGALLLQLQETSGRARQTAEDRALSGQLPEALCMINMALENCPQDGRLYLFRGILYRRLKDFTAAIEDLVQAVELDEEAGEESRCQVKATDEEAGEDSRCQLVLTYNDFAVQCFSKGLYAEAMVLLNKGIDEEKEQAGLYLNRGDCFFMQGEWCYALADYRQAEEMMKPDDPAVRFRLAVLYNRLGSFSFQEGCFQEAADRFSLAIQYNPTAGQYYENRAKAFRKLMNLEGARRDFICTQILDPNSEELPPMLMSLFPGCSVSDVLSSQTGRAVRVQLMDDIQARSSSPDQQRLSEKLQTMTLTSESRASQSEDASEAGRELQMMMKSTLQQKNGALQSFLHHRPALHHTEPRLTTHGPPPPSPTLQKRTKPPLDMKGMHTAKRELKCLEFTSQK
ncbi:tetratricopeptide repeat protein 16-like%2C partial [Scomber scombrus]|uniref:Tetratricopeptide repeat protein 16-like, partial n=1 Tax=Scomber scombrus TaxID=13677 RepID=A0AAV1PWT9_SCOSC